MATDQFVLQRIEVRKNGIVPAEGMTYRASTASLLTTRFGSSRAFASSRITVAFCGCRTSYLTTLGSVARYRKAATRTLCSNEGE